MAGKKKAPESESDRDDQSRPSFGRSGRAAGELVVALRQDFSVAAHNAARKLSAAAARLRARVGETDISRLEARLGAIAGSIRGLPGTMTPLAERWRGFRAASESGRPAGAGRRRLTWFRALALASIAGLALAVGLFYWALRDVPWQEIAEGSLKPVVVLESADGTPIVQQGPFQGGYAKREEFPPHLIDAVLAIEDRRFYEHYGIDFRGVGRAIWRNLRAGEVVEGGSTITQQLIKILYLESDRTFKRKIQELVIAFWLEGKFGKDEILTRYLNNIYLGAGATGVPAAARVYFDKAVNELDLRESALLAGIIRAPSQLNPLTNPQGAAERTSVVLDVMVENGKLEAAGAAAAKAEFATLHPTRPAERAGSWFSDWVIQDAREIAGPYRGTIKVRTTIIPRLQALAEKAVKDALDAEGQQANASQAALVAMTPDGAVVAMVGGLDYGKSEFNRAVTAMRQPGSTFKLFVLYAALKAGLSPRDRVEDRPIEIAGWAPENFGGEYNGRVSIAEAFARSLNAAMVNLAQEVGIKNVAAAARELGIDAKLAETPALALGASEVNLLDITGTFASVRAGVAPIEPWGIISFQSEGQPQAFRVGPSKQPDVDLSAVQRDLVGLLQLVVARGTGKEAAIDGFAAGKTGTSQNHRDAWFIGFSEPLVAGVWIGNDDDSPMNKMTGGKLPAAIWRNFMSVALADAAGEPQGEAVTASADADAPVACNVRACSRSYRSFRAEDCTFQPYRGPRRLCEK
ncbi:PBP1A family penicillin-binding protein [Mesorhizobium escarrei]|uniref:Lectin-like protein BA14k n=1 Tax=Mesorhizobium escarrei TaxID=666018 RepID=A0ABN8KHD6_9HYPH|nr:PBP1A family penicillin-binding protein [Mesorhizobium escarrei]CAH2408200.1 Lectin-like protein BA14k [Mesorhizobium escarrei]